MGILETRMRYLFFTPFDLSGLNVDKVKTFVLKYPQGLGQPYHALEKKMPTQ